MDIVNVPDPVEPAADGLGHAAVGLCLAERFFDLFPAPLGQGVAGMLGSPSIDGGMPGLLCDTRRHHYPPERGDEVGTVILSIHSKRLKRTAIS